MKYIGLFLDGNLMRKYLYTNEGIIEAIEDCKLAFEETEMFHELKFIE
jgi:hypothetical protein